MKLSFPVKLLIIILMQLSCDSFNEKNGLLQDYSGHFKVKINSGVSYTTEELDYYSNTILDLNQDGTFSFNKPIPAQRGSYGKWKVEGNPIERRIVLKYNSCYTIQLNPCLRKGCVFSIWIPVYSGNILKYHKKLFFEN